MRFTTDHASRRTGRHPSGRIAMRIGFIAALILLLITPVLRGQDPLSSHLLQNAVLFNPAYMGELELPRLVVSGQNVTETLDSLEQNSFEATYSGPLGERHRLGGTIVFVYEPFVGQYLEFEANYAYLAINEKRQQLSLGLGLGTGRGQLVVSADRTVFPGQVDQPALWFPVVSGGVWYRYRDFFVGVGGKHLTQPLLEYSQSVKIRVEDLYTALIGYDFMGLAPIRITPMVNARFESSADLFTDFIIDADYDNRFGVGIGYRTDLGQKEVFAPGVGTGSWRLHQLLFTMGFGWAEAYRLDLGYQLLVTNTVPTVRNRNNIELTFSADFGPKADKAPPPAVGMRTSPLPAQ